MKQRDSWMWRTSEWKGVRKLPSTNNEIAKKYFIKVILGNLVQQLDCGWIGCEYIIWQYDTSDPKSLTEYVALVPKQGLEYAKLVCIDCDSKLAIVKDIVDNLE